MKSEVHEFDSSAPGAPFIPIRIALHYGHSDRIEKVQRVEEKGKVERLRQARATPPEASTRLQLNGEGLQLLKLSRQLLKLELASGRTNSRARSQARRRYY